MYNVIVLAEQVLSAGDAAELVSLHEAIDEPRHYHLLIPCENAQVRAKPPSARSPPVRCWPHRQSSPTR